MEKHLSITAAFHKCIEITHGVWTAEERELYFNVTEDGEGAGEKSYRKRMGWPLTVRGTGHGDFPDGSEGKSLAQRNSKKIDYVLPDLGLLGKRGNGKIVRSLVKNHEDVLDKHEIRVLDGEINPVLFRELYPLFDVSILASNVITFPAIILMDEYGFLRINKCNYDEVFIPYKTTKASLRYKLSKTYFEEIIKNANRTNPRLLHTLSCRSS